MNEGAAAGSSEIEALPAGSRSSRIRRHRLVEMELFDLVRDRMDGLVGQTARLSSIRLARTARTGSVNVSAGRRPGPGLEEAPEAVEVTPGAVDAGFGPLKIALGRAVGQHEEARGVGAVSVDGRAGIDDVELRFAHLLRAARR